MDDVMKDEALQICAVTAGHLDLDPHFVTIGTVESKALESDDDDGWATDTSYTSSDSAVYPRLFDSDDSF